MSLTRLSERCEKGRELLLLQNGMREEEASEIVRRLKDMCTGTCYHGIGRDAWKRENVNWNAIDKKIREILRGKPVSEVLALPIKRERMTSRLKVGRRVILMRNGVDVEEAGEIVKSLMQRHCYVTSTSLWGTHVIPYWNEIDNNLYRLLRRFHRHRRRAALQISIFLSLWIRERGV